MTLFYSAGTGGFYDDSLHTDIPGDAVKITAKRHAELLAAQSQGHAIKPGKEGRPAAVAPRKPTLAEWRANQVRQVKREAARRIDLVAPIWKQLNAMRDGTTEIFASIDAIRAASNDLESQVSSMNVAQLETLDTRADEFWPPLA